MPDPFAPRPCPDCETVLPSKVLDAIELLYHRQTIDVDRLATALAADLRPEKIAKRAAWRASVRLPALTQEQAERETAEWAVLYTVLDGLTGNDLAAAVRH